VPQPGSETGYQRDRAGRPRDTTVLIPGPGIPAAWRAAEAPVLAPKRPTGRCPVAASFLDPPGGSHHPSGQQPDVESTGQIVFLFGSQKIHQQGSHSCSAKDTRHKTVPGGNTGTTRFRGQKAPVLPVFREAPGTPRPPHPGRGCGREGENSWKGRRMHCDRNAPVAK
jgi:hypothetical protein